MERLTIKELAPYLPFKLQWKFEGSDEVHEVMGIDITDFGVHLFSPYGDYGKCRINEGKPLLRPISSIDLKWFKDNIDEYLEDFRINCEPENNHFSVEVCEKVLGWSALSLEEYQLFYRDHVDIHGLIDRNLALPIDGKEEEGE